MMLDWGTVPAFLSLFVALWALTEARQARRWQRRDDLQDQARKIHVSPQIASDVGSNLLDVVISVENLSEYPVTNVWLLTRSQLLHSDVDLVECIARLEPGGTFRVKQVVAANPDPYPISGDDHLRVTATFVDHNGYKWQRWATGEIKPPISLRARSRPMRLMWKVLPNSILMRWLGRENRPPVRQRLPPQ